ncbi:MAG: amylo-alpha-1,6-glucosidase [Candidatus Obscuribacter phosphatis]|uniref:Amylo-alpha-1,6-glucosidase n=1 Tax=Candidatus Obscuribacter phosphatis TaxID=1906157 RepID=A0A8J7PJP4_9BACT|nr:amylo-alpha-1,6-glucosidase [Candidatus Obscuribacter phosphatis]
MAKESRQKKLKENTTNFTPLFSKPLSKVLVLPMLLTLMQSGLLSVIASPEAGATQAKETTKNTEDSLKKQRLILKNGSFFVVLAPDGFMGKEKEETPYGLYKGDTRYLTAETISLTSGIKPKPGLSSRLPLNLSKADTTAGYKAVFEYDGKVKLKRELLVKGGLFERLTFTNTLKDKETKIKVSCRALADFKDMFEVRGQKRKERGTFDTKAMTAVYKGLDGKALSTSLLLAVPDSTKARENGDKDNDNKGGELTSEFALTLAPAQDAEQGKQKAIVELAYVPDLTSHKKVNFDEALKQADADFAAFTKGLLKVRTNLPEVNQAFAQAERDLFLLHLDIDTDKHKGGAFAAGLPWYAVPFGRDQLILGRMLMPYAPHLAKEVILFLAAYQGDKLNKTVEEAPGKIMHELRDGEMARLKEIPFTPYYGSADATPLWLTLIKQYIDTTGDTTILADLDKNIDLALSYLEKETADDFLYYGDKEGKAALTNQAWKDSGDSVMHKDGRLAGGPIAICEVQAYLYDAWLAAASFKQMGGKTDEAEKLKEKAARLKEHFQKAFFEEKNDFPALAIDGAGRPCQVTASNAGHLLVSDIISPKQARAICDRLMQEGMYSGFGIRTLSQGENRYDPESYHNGSVWPHDNAMIIEGMRKRGFQEEAQKIACALLLLAAQSEDKRLPELFCGYKKEGKLPKPYAVSCVPQLWCVGALYQTMTVLLDLQVSQGDLVVKDRLPSMFQQVSISGELNNKPVDLVVKRN